MANSDSSAIVRFVEHVQAEPILETERPVIHDTVPTELMEPPKQHPLRGYLVTAAIAAVLGIGGAFYLAESGGEQAATSARAGLVGVDNAEHAKTQPAAVRHEPPTEPTAAPVALPLPERDSEAEPTPTPAETSPAPTPVSDPTAAAPAVATGESDTDPAVSVDPAKEAAPAVQEDAAAEAEPAVAVAAPAKAAPAAPKAKKSKAKRRSKKARKARRSKKAKKSVASASGGKGTLMLGAKPPCRIYIDGRNTGKMTPQRGISLPAGKHKILLVNKEYNIKSRATVVIKTGKKTRVIRDLSDRIK